MSKIPFNHRLGYNNSKQITHDFPESGRVALTYLLQDLINRGFIICNDENIGWLENWYPVITELRRTGRKAYVDEEPFQTPADLAGWLLYEMEWEQVYISCERIYDRVLNNINEAREYFSDEVNNILIEENVAFRFQDGQFFKRGRPQTQKNINRVGLVLNDPALEKVRTHYNKAQKFFNERPEADVGNCVKEALCALEATLEVITGKTAAKDFSKIIQQLQGNDIEQIPAPIAQSMVKLHGYRGSGQGVAHAALTGNKVSEIEAELVLSLVAAYISYLYDSLFKDEEEIPF
jgi:hypothetical protein